MPRPYSILLVDDNDSLRQILVELLGERGWTVYAADGSAPALDTARRVELDFGILDLHLPGSTGLEIFRTINQEIRPLPSIMMSGEATAQETNAAREAGIFSFLRKPIAFAELQTTLDQLIQHHFPPGPPLGPPIS